MNHDIQTAALAARLDKATFFTGREENAEGWHLAGERMLLYLKGLRLAPEDQLLVSLEAIRRAKARRSATTEPVAECLEALWQLLKERSLPADVPRQFAMGANRRSGRNRQAWPNTVSFPSAFQLNLQAQPAMQRQCMISAPMELVPWRQTTLRTLEAVRKPVEEFLYRRGTLLGGVFMLLAVLALK